MASINITQCFWDSSEAYRKHFFVMLLAGLLSNVLGILTLSILLGVLQAGMLMMMLRAIRGGEEIRLDDLFTYISRRRVRRTFVVFWGSLLIVTAGFLCMILPGLVFGAWLIYPLLLAVDQDMTFGEAIAESKRAVSSHGLLKHILLWIIMIILSLFPAVIGSGGREQQGTSGLVASLVGSGTYLSLLISTFLDPFITGLVASAYHQIYDDGVTESWSDGGL